MIKTIQQGKYRLLETQKQSKILILDGKTTYAWVYVKDIGELLVATHKTHKTDQLLAVGTYILYDVKNDPDLSDHLHLELSVGDGEWQGYLLLTGFPKSPKIRSRIIPTSETITQSG